MRPELDQPSAGPGVLLAELLELLRRGPVGGLGVVRRRVLLLGCRGGGGGGRAAGAGAAGAAGGAGGAGGARRPGGGCRRLRRVGRGSRRRRGAGVLGT